MAASAACGSDKGGETDDATSTSETGETGTTGETGATGEPDTGATSTSTTGEPDTGETVDPPTGTTGETSLLETCVFEPLCAHEIGPDFTDSEEQVYEGLLCAWTRLRDAAPSRVDLTFGGDDPTSLIPLGDPDRAVLVVKSAGGETVQRCTLAEEIFFQTCIDAGPEGLGESCAFGYGWWVDCVDEPSPVCPG
ncbi:hypothetical protein [Nannocystis pusilla]|uniref:hypothetical protein n=1 Tax=Nannocystis pusilla TaxID=889268 RepID=UPI003DA3B706